MNLHNIKNVSEWSVNGLIDTFLVCYSNLKN